MVRGFGIYLIVRRSDDIIIGGIGFHGKPEHGRVEVGYDVASKAQAQGYATEALRALAGWALRQSEVEVVVGRTEAGNIASRRVMEKAGFIPSGGPDAEGLHSFELRGPQKEDGGAKPLGRVGPRDEIDQGRPTVVPFQSLRRRMRKDAAVRHRLVAWAAAAWGPVGGL